MPETEAVTRHAGDLSGTDIGTTVTVSTSAWVIVGKLQEVEHGCDWANAEKSDSAGAGTYPVWQWVNFDYRTVVR